MHSHAPSRHGRSDLPGTPLLIFMGVSFAVVLPFFFLGIPSGHDFEFHMNSWMEVVNQWRHGIVYPRWAALAHHGYGEPRFVFYPPASWMLGAALGALLPWKIVPEAFAWIALTVSGCSMFLLARSWLDHNSALFAAVAYAANPYFLVIVYWRSAFAELLAGAWLPLLVLFMVREEKRADRVIVPVGLVICAVWLTNAPAGVMACYSLALLSLIVAVARRSSRSLLHGASAVLLGLALAAFYVLPAAWEEKWVNIAQVLSPGVRPDDNFLFTTIADADHNRFNRLVSLVAASEIMVFAAAAIFSRGRHGKSTIWTALAAWAAAATLIMCSFTRIAWRYLPELQYLQLPWRWLLCLNVALALLVAMAWPRARLAVWLTMLSVVPFVWHGVQPPWWDTAADIAAMHRSHESGQGYEGTDEYVSDGADAYDVNPNARKVTLQDSGAAQIRIERWEPELRMFSVQSPQPEHLLVKLFNYPAWQVEVNGQIADQTSDDAGQMIIPVAAGENQVRLTFVRTWDRTAGGIISLATAGLLVLWWAATRRPVHTAGVAKT